MLNSGTEEDFATYFAQNFDEIVTKHENTPKITKTFIREAKRYHDVPVATCVYSRAEVIQMYNFWERKIKNSTEKIHR